MDRFAPSSGGPVPPATDRTTHPASRTVGHPSVLRTLTLLAFGLLGAALLGAATPEGGSATADHPSDHASVLEPGTDPCAPVDGILTGRPLDAPGVLVGVVTPDMGLACHRTVGLANVGHWVPMDRYTRINVGSTAKTLTAWAMARLELDGVLSLDDEVRHWIPELPELESPVTLRHLLTHTSGYREFLNALAVGGWRIEDGDFIHPDEVVRVVSHQPRLQNEPGAERIYNNTGYVLLARVVEAATGTPFPRWIQEEVFEPLGMERSVFRTDAGQIIPDAAYGYRPAPVGASPAPGSSDAGAAGWVKAPDVGSPIGAGGLYTTMDDLARWLTALTGDDPRWSEPFALMREPFVLNDGSATNYGLGLEVDLMAGLERLHHPGGDLGHRAEFMWFPEREVGLMVLTNDAGLPPTLPGRIVRAVLGVDDPDAFAAEPREEAPPETGDEPGDADGPDGTGADGSEPATPGLTDPEYLALLAGRYELEAQPGFVLTIRISGEGLEAQATGQPPFSLTPQADSSWTLDAVGARLTFHHEDPDGSPMATSLVLHQGGASLPAPRIGSDEEDVDFRAFEGRYRSAEFETEYVVRAEDGGLRLEHRRRDAVVVTPVAEDRFSGPFPFFGVEFVRDEEGRVTGFVADAIRARDLAFHRVEGGAGPDG